MLNSKVCRGISHHTHRISEHHQHKPPCVLLELPCFHRLPTDHAVSAAPGRYLGGGGGRQCYSNSCGKKNPHHNQQPLGLGAFIGRFGLVPHLWRIYSSVFSPTQRRPFDIPHVHTSFFPPCGTTEVLYPQPISHTIVYVYCNTVLPFPVQTRRVAAAHSLPQRDGDTNRVCAPDEAA